MIDMSKKYRTRDGRDVRVYAVDAGGEWPVHGATLEPETTAGWQTEEWTQGGNCYSEGNHSCHDLVEVKAEAWIWRYASGLKSSHAHDTKEQCEKWRGTPEPLGKAVRFVQEDE